MVTTTASSVVPSPCVGICTLDPHGLCVGCYRTMAEIAQWVQMDDAQRLHLMEVLLPCRQAAGR